MEELLVDLQTEFLPRPQFVKFFDPSTRVHDKSLIKMQSELDESKKSWADLVETEDWQMRHSFLLFRFGQNETNI